MKRANRFIIIGHRRHEVHSKQAAQAYRQRFDHEHFLRFGKRNLLFTAYQTPEAESVRYCPKEPVIPRLR